MAAPLSKVHLDELPLETIQLIATFLHQTDRPSCHAFSLSSRNLQKAALPSTFHKINLTVGDPNMLKLDINALSETLSRTESARHVRCLSLKAFLHVGGDYARKIESDSMTAGQTSSIRDSGVERKFWEVKSHYFHFLAITTRITDP